MATPGSIYLKFQDTTLLDVAEVVNNGCTYQVNANLCAYIYANVDVISWRGDWVARNVQCKLAGVLTYSSRNPWWCQRAHIAHHGAFQELLYKDTLQQMLWKPALMCSCEASWGPTCNKTIHKTGTLRQSTVLLSFCTWCPRLSVHYASFKPQWWRLSYTERGVERPVV